MGFLLLNLFSELDGLLKDVEDKIKTSRESTLIGYVLYYTEIF